MKPTPYAIFFGLITTIALVCLNPAPAFGEEQTDSSSVSLAPREDKGPVDYILWPISTALKLPWRAVSYTVSQPIKLIENQNLLPTLIDYFSFAEQWGIYPVLNYKSTSGISGGIGFHERNLFYRGVGLKAKATYSTNTYRYASVRLGGESWGGKPFGISGCLGWRADTRERFFGIGSSSDVNNRTSYGYRGMFGELTGHWQPAEGSAADFFVARRSIDPEDGRYTKVPHQLDSIAVIFAGQNLFGLCEKIDFTEFGVDLKYDRRRRPGSPLGGGMANLHISYITGEAENGTKIGFWKYQAEVGHYFNLFSGRVICLRVQTELTDPIIGKPVPFYRMARLGGKSSLRGYTGGRYTDLDLVATSVEYRWPLWRRIDAFIFTDQGGVFHDIWKDFRLTRIRSSYGFGIKLWRAAGNSSLTFARSKEAFKFYFRLES